MFHAIGDFCYRFRWLVIGLWIVLFAVSIIATPYLADVLNAGFNDPNAPSEQASALIQETFNQGETNLLVIFKSETMQAKSKEFMAVEQAALDLLVSRNVADLQSIQSYMSTGSDLLVSTHLPRRCRGRSRTSGRPSPADRSPRTSPGRRR